MIYVCRLVERGEDFSSLCVQPPPPPDVIKIKTKINNDEKVLATVTKKKNKGKVLKSSGQVRSWRDVTGDVTRRRLLLTFWKWMVETFNSKFRGSGKLKFRQEIDWLLIILARECQRQVTNSTWRSDLLSPVTHLYSQNGLPVVFQLLNFTDLPRAIKIVRQVTQKSEFNWISRRVWLGVRFTECDLWGQSGFSLTFFYQDGLKYFLWNF